MVENFNINENNDYLEDNPKFTSFQFVIEEICSKLFKKNPQ
jgi:hypothetical protein